MISQTCSAFAKSMAISGRTEYFKEAACAKESHPTSKTISANSLFTLTDFRTYVSRVLRSVVDVVESENLRNRIVRVENNGLFSSFLVLWTLWLAIGLISAYDCFLTLKYAVSLNQLESNAIASAMMRIDPNTQVQISNVAFFCGLKCAGTVFVVAVLHLLCKYQPRLGSISTWGVFGFQFWLLLQLFVPFGAY